MNQLGQTTALLRAYSEHPIVYYPVYAEITGSVTAGVLLSQLLYWWYKMREREFYKTDQEFADELSMGVYELRGAREKLVKAGLISTMRKGLPRKMHYVVHEDRLVALITSVRKTPTLVFDKTEDCSEEKPHTPVQETTHETTHEITKMATASLVKSDPLDEQADKTIDCLNGLAGTKYRHSKQSRKFIRARIREGATLEDCQLIIEHKASEWRFDAEMSSYLRPSTLFRPSHFEEYLAAAIRWHEDGRPLTKEATKQKARMRSKVIIAEGERRGLRRTGPDGNPLPVDSPTGEIADAIGGSFGDGF